MEKQEQYNLKSNHICKTDGCERGVYAKEHCRKHYTRKKNRENNNGREIMCEYPDCKEIILISDRITHPYCSEHLKKTRANINNGLNKHSKLEITKGIKFLRKCIRKDLSCYKDLEILKLIEQSKKVIKELEDERMQCALKEYYFNGCTLIGTSNRVVRADGTINPVTRERIRQVLAKAIRHVKYSPKRNMILSVLNDSTSERI